MTAEHLTILEPSDLRSMRLVCIKCRGSVTIRLNETINTPGQCPACGNGWRVPEHQGAANAAERLGFAVKQWLEFANTGRAPFTFHFEIESHEKAKP
jgi:hypothetical protein